MAISPNMSWRVAEVIANLSTFVRLAPGDLIFTSTPARRSTVVRGDVLEGSVADVGEFCVSLSSRNAGFSHSGPETGKGEGEK